MNKYEYFKYAYGLGLIGNRTWLLRVFSVPTVTPEIEHKTGMVFFDQKGLANFIDAEGNTVTIEDHKKGSPLYAVKEEVTAKAGDFKITDKDYKTYYSNLLLNVLLLDIPFDGKVAFHNGTFNRKLLDGILVKGLKDRTITVEQYGTFSKCMAILNALAPVITPSATYKGIVPPKDMVSYRNKLLKQYEGQLDDPIVISKIEQALVDHYKEYIKGDPAEGYYIDKKGMNVALKRSAMMFGGEPKLDDTTKVNLNVPSLMEGWDMDKLPDMINSLRMGSYSRGKETALGGEAAKFSARVYQNTKLTDKDCGSIVGVPFRITTYNADAFVGRYRIVSGKPKEIKAGDLNGFIGKTVIIRSPMTCWEKNGNYCPVCMGREISESGIGIGVMASAISSVMLNVFMSKMHGRVLEYAEYDYEQSIK